MNILVVEDDFISRVLLQEFLKPYGTCHMASNGAEALIAVDGMLDRKTPYELICLDIMMPEMDGHTLLKKIRELERQRRIGGKDAVKVIMTTALDDPKNIMKALVRGGCEGYLTKPIDLDKMKELLAGMDFHPQPVVAPSPA